MQDRKSAREEFENWIELPIAPVWRDNLDARELRELELAETYAKKFAHGTDGHNRLILLAKLVQLLDTGFAPLRKNE